MDSKSFLVHFFQNIEPRESKVNPSKAGPPPAVIRGLIAGLIKGNQWVFIVPDHKAGYFLRGKRSFGGGSYS